MAWNNNYNNNSGEKEKEYLNMYSVPTYTFTNVGSTDGVRNNKLVFGYTHNAILEAGIMKPLASGDWDWKNKHSIYLFDKDAYKLLKALPGLYSGEYPSIAVSSRHGHFVISRPEVYGTKGYIISIVKEINGTMSEYQYETVSSQDDSALVYVGIDLENNKCAGTIELDKPYELTSLEYLFEEYIKARSGAQAAAARVVNKRELLALGKSLGIDKQERSSAATSGMNSFSVADATSDVPDEYSMGGLKSKLSLLQ